MGFFSRFGFPSHLEQHYFLQSASSWSFFRYTIFATHMENLSELATINHNAKILHFHVDVKSNRLDFKVILLSFLLMGKFSL